MLTLARWVRLAKVATVLRFSSFALEPPNHAGVVRQFLFSKSTPPPLSLNKKDCRNEGGGGTQSKAREPDPWAISLRNPATGATGFISSCLGKISHFGCCDSFARCYIAPGNPLGTGPRCDSFYCRWPPPHTAPAVAPQRLEPLARY